GRHRDGLHQILAQQKIDDIGSDPRLGRADKLKRIKEQLRRVRLPRLSRIEDTIRAPTQELKLPPAVRMSVPFGLEGGKLCVEISASTAQELKKLIAQLAEAADRDSIKDIFRMLAGETAEDG